ncbi:CHAT domain-containing protein [Massilia suwonensis]|uniref:CHAT domain-containing protein n=1 Tax=Massilia suwonensis TaxID=648895 RepID=A0ABW0MKJ0_9BURK
MMYQNFDLEIISPKGSDRLCARVLESPQGDCPFIDVKWPFDAEQENVLLSEIYGGLRQRHGRSSKANTIQDFGGKLFEAVFAGDIEHLFRSSLDSSFRCGKGLRVRLRLPEDSELHERPWEFLFDTESREFLAVREHTPLVRYLPVAQPIPPITVEGPLRVLVALSSPTDHPRLDIAREWDILRSALEPSISAGQLELRRVPGRCTFDNLRDSLRHFGAHIFHFVGHGIPGALVLEQESGKGLEMEATHLRSAFPSGALPRLIVLNACSGAITQDVPFSGLAQGFLRQGVPAVVAMQASITDDAALIFTRYFYRDLVEIGAVDTSLTEARLRMQGNGHPIEWGTPVLYMRALSGQLFQPAPNPAELKKPGDTPWQAETPPSVVEQRVNRRRKTRETQETPPAPAVPYGASPKKPRAPRPKEHGPQPPIHCAPLHPEADAPPMMTSAGASAAPLPPYADVTEPNSAPPIPEALFTAPVPKPALPERETAPQSTPPEPAPERMPEADPAPAMPPAAPTVQVWEFKAPPAVQDQAPPAETEDLTMPLAPAPPEPAGKGRRKPPIKKIKPVPVAEPKAAAPAPPVREPVLDTQAIPAASPASAGGPRFILEPEPNLLPGTETGAMPPDAPAPPSPARGPHARRLLLGGVAAGLLVTVLAVTVGSGDKNRTPAGTTAPAPASTGVTGPPSESVPAAGTDSFPASAPIITPSAPPQDVAPPAVDSRASQTTGLAATTPAPKPKARPSASRKPQAKTKSDNCKNVDANERDASCVFR